MLLHQRRINSDTISVSVSVSFGDTNSENEKGCVWAFLLQGYHIGGMLKMSDSGHSLGFLNQSHKCFEQCENLTTKAPDSRCPQDPLSQHLQPTRAGMLSIMTFQRVTVRRAVAHPSTRLPEESCLSEGSWRPVGVSSGAAGSTGFSDGRAPYASERKYLDGGNSALVIGF